MSTLYDQLCEMGLVFQLLLGVLGLFFFIQLFYYIYYYSAPLKALKSPSSKDNEKLPPVSIIVCAQNEAENLKQFIPKLLEQKYPNKFEVIVVNDGSTDESAEVLERMAQEHSNLKISFLPRAAKYMSRKKMCLSIGIKAAAYDVYLFTDADCCPSSQLWLEIMVRNLNNSNDVVLGATRFNKLEGMIGNLIDYDNLFNTIRYMGYALRGNIFRGTIRNMAYKKNIYYKAKGFSKHLDLDTGEDDILLRDANVKDNVCVELNSNAITICNRQLTAKSYRLMKEQRLDNRKFYRTGTRFSLGFENVSRMLFYLLTIALVVFATLECQWLALGITAFLFLARYITQAVVMSKNAKWLGCKAHPLGIIFFDFYLPIYEQYLNTIGRIGRKRWEMWRE